MPDNDPAALRMDLHFRAFSFVDRITSSQDGRQVAGRYWIPEQVCDFPSSLVAEAVGQLAAWSAMAAVGFHQRPVAGLAGRVTMFQEVRPGQTLELTADIESVDAEAVAYGGSASVSGTPVLQLEHCVGPMMPLEQFDDPQLVQHRYLQLTGEGATPGAFCGVPDIPLHALEWGQEDCLRAQLHVPETADFFADHFPHRAVFPGTLLTHSALQLVLAMLATSKTNPPGTHWTPQTITDLKLRSFISPGEVLELEARRSENAVANRQFALQIRNRGKRIGSCSVQGTGKSAP